MKILLVDDSKSARYALRLQLQRHGITVETADAAEPALERVRDDPPDAIFMDHTMPGMNGFEALDILQASSATAHIPVVMCTSNEDPDFAAQAKRKGAVDILSKSSAGEKLADLLERLQRAMAAPRGAAAAARGAGRSTAQLPSAMQVEEIVRGAIGPLLDERAERLAGELTAKVEERIEARIGTSIGSLRDDLSAGLAEDLSAKMDERLVSSLDKEAQKLQQHFLKVQKEHTQLSAKRLLEESLPQLLREHFAKEEQGLAAIVQESVDATLRARIAEPSFQRHILDAVGARACERAEQAAERRATEIATAVAKERAEALSRGPTDRGDGRMVLLAAGAAFVGVAAATVVFFLLS